MEDLATCGITMATIPGGAVAIHGYAEIKSKFDAEFRRFSLDKSRYVFHGCRLGFVLNEKTFVLGQKG